MTEQLVAALREAVEEIATTALFLEITPGTAAPQRCEMATDYTAVVAYSGSMEGSLCLSGSVAAVVTLAAALLGEERSAMDDELYDAFSELCNMVAGGVQTRMETDVGPIQMSTPVMIAGQGHHVFGDQKTLCLHHPFTVGQHPFFVEIFHRPIVPAEDGV
jgi:chemotaxis protein CheX